MAARRFCIRPDDDIQGYLFGEKLRIGPYCLEASDTRHKAAKRPDHENHDEDAQPARESASHV